jgi:hypothetical protein
MKQTRCMWSSNGRGIGYFRRHSKLPLRRAGWPQEVGSRIATPSWSSTIAHPSSSTLNGPHWPLTRSQPQGCCNARCSRGGWSPACSRHRTTQCGDNRWTGHVLCWGHPRTTHAQGVPLPPALSRVSILSHRVSSSRGRASPLGHWR